MIVQRFLHWLDTAPNSSRADAAAALARASLHSTMTAHEKEAADAALTLLLDDPSSKVRYAMADVLASQPTAPRHLIMTLARDQSDIAMLVLCRSPLFLDSELIDIAENGDSVSLMAIACRQPVSNQVAAALVHSGDFDACLALLQNTSIKLTADNLRQIGTRMGQRPDIREALLAQKNLPADIRQTLIVSLSSALEELVVAKSWLSENRAKKAIREARDRSTAQLAFTVDQDEVPLLVEHLRKSGQLTAAFLLRTLCIGNVYLFTAAISNLTGIPENRIIAVLQQGRTAAFRAIYDRSGLPQSAIPAITAAVDIWRDEDEISAIGDESLRQCQIVERIINQYLKATPQPDQKLLALLRRISSEVARDAALLRARERSDAA